MMNHFYSEQHVNPLRMHSVRELGGWCDGKLWGSGTALYLGAGSYLDSIYRNFVFYYMKIDKRE